MSINYGVVDLSEIDTTPGSGSAFSPPANWQGDYQRFMRSRFASDLGACQHMTIVGRHLTNKTLHAPPVFKGPYAEQAAAIAAKCA